MDIDEFKKHIEGEYEILVEDNKLEKAFLIADGPNKDVSETINQLLQSKKIKEASSSIMDEPFEIEPPIQTKPSSAPKKGKTTTQAKPPVKQPSSKTNVANNIVRIVELGKESKTEQKTYSIHPEFQDALSKIGTYRGLGGSSETIRFLIDHFLNHLSADERKVCLEGKDHKASW